MFSREIKAPLIMSQITIYHNPRCSKSRQTLALLEEKGVSPSIIEYLSQPPSPDELSDLLGKLGLAASDLVRKKEPPFSDLGLGSPEVTDADLVAAMCENPILIERPIVTDGDRAVLGRPPENVLALLH